MNLRLTLPLFIAAVLPLTQACASDEDEIAQAPALAQRVSALETTTRSAPDEASSAPASVVTLPPEVIRLLELMDLFGAGAEATYQLALQVLISMPNGLDILRAAYETFPMEDQASRWKLVFVAGKIPTTNSLAFLEETVFAPDVLTNVDPADSHHLNYRENLSEKMAAAFGMVSFLARYVPGADAAVSRVLTHANEEVARMAAVELFRHNRLEQRFKALLDARGIFSNIRRLTPIENAELMDIRPRERVDGVQRDTSVPPASGM